MRTPVRLCEDYDAPHLRALAKASRDANQTRRLVDLAQWVHAEFGILVSQQTLSRILRGMSYRKLSAS